MAKKKRFKIPYSLLPLGLLRSYAYTLRGVGKKLEPVFPYLKVSFKQLEIEFSLAEYIAMCLLSTIVDFVFLSAFLTPIFFFAEISLWLLFPIVFVVCLFIFVQQILYPKLLANRRVLAIEKNLLPVLQNMLVQLNSGIPLFNIMLNVSISNYSEISEEFKRVVKEINAGQEQIVVLEDLAARTPSLFFRRAIWQLINGMKGGVDIASTMRSIISSLSEQQLIQIQSYGNQLSPLAMFYMLIAIIIPSLGMTFLIVIASFIAMSGTLTKVIFLLLYIFTTFFQVMFLGMIKTRRPSLLED